MDNRIGIAGWLFSQEILRDNTMTLLEFPAQCAALGVETVELCSRFFTSQETAYLNQVRTALEDSGLEVWNIAVDMGNIAGVDPAVRHTDIAGLKQWFYTAAALKCPAIRINSGNADDPQALARAIDGYLELAAVGHQAGVKLLLENHGGLSADSKHMATILAALPAESFGTCPDTANFAPGDWQEGMAVLAPRAFSCHAKIFAHSPDGTQTWTDRSGQERTHNLKTCLEALKATDYQGPLCLEKEATIPAIERRQNIKNSLAYLAELASQI